MNLADGEIICLLHSPKIIRRRNKFLFDPAFYKWGEPMEVPSHWGLEDTVRKIAGNRQFLWHRYTMPEYKDWRWFASIVATDDPKVVRIEHLSDLCEEEKDFLESMTEVHLPENLATFLS